MATTSFQGGGYPGRPYGDFSGKAADAGNGPHNPGRITTLWAYGGSGHLYGSFAGKEESDAVVVVTETTTVGRAGKRVRIRQRILLRIEGQEYELNSLAEAVALIKAAKKDVPAVARTKAAEIVLSGKRIGDAKREEKPIEVVSAPSSVKAIIEDRIEEMQRFYWARIAAQVKALEDDDDEIMMLL